MDFIDGYGLLLIDGQRIMGEYGTGLNQIPIDLIERVEVVKGPSSALYGSDALAGVTNIRTYYHQKIPKKATGIAGAAYGWYKVKEKVVVNDGMGHRLALKTNIDKTLNLKITNKQQNKGTNGSSLFKYERALMGISIIFGISGIFFWWKGRRYF